LREFLGNVYEALKRDFSDFEIILVNNGSRFDINSIISQLEQEIRKSIYTINLSKRIDPNNAIVAGLDRANGDYTIIFDTYFYNNVSLIGDLYQKTRENYDVVYLRYKKRYIPWHKRIPVKLFYMIMKKYSDLDIDINMHQNRIISRRALNGLLQVRESLRYMKGIFSSVGYNTSFVEVDIPEQNTSGKFSDQFQTALIAITSFTDIPSKLLLWMFFLSVLFCCYVVINALMVKFAGHDVFGMPQAQVPGWAYLVILISIIFVLLSFILYILSIYIISINKEIKKRPVYIVESFQRY
jgi:hypothetical protein